SALPVEHDHDVRRQPGRPASHLLLAVGLVLHRLPGRLHRPLVAPPEGPAGLLRELLLHGLQRVDRDDPAHAESLSVHRRQRLRRIRSTGTTGSREASASSPASTTPTRFGSTATRGAAPSSSRPRTTFRSSASSWSATRRSTRTSARSPDGASRSAS